MSDIQKEYKGREAFKREVRSCHLTLYTVYYVAYINLKSPDCAVFDTRKKVQLRPLYLETYGVKKTSDITREFHFKVITIQDVSIYVNICTTLNITFTNINCEGFSITHFLYFYPLFFLSYFTLILSHLYYSFTMIISKELCNIIKYSF